MPEQNEQEGTSVEKKMSGRVFYVQSEDDSTVLVAMDVRVNLAQKTISWLDTVKERMFEYESIHNTDLNDFTIKTKDGRTYHFQPMTLSNYNESVKDHLINGKNFSQEEDMIRAFENTKENIW